MVQLENWRQRLTRKQLLQSAAAAVPALMCAGRAGAATRWPVSRYRPAASGLRGVNVVVFLTDQERAIQHFPPGWSQANLPGLTRLQRNGFTFRRAFTNTGTAREERELQPLKRKLAAVQKTRLQPL